MIAPTFLENLAQQEALSEQLRLKLLTHQNKEMRRVVEYLDLTGSVTDPADRYSDDGEQWDPINAGSYGGVTGAGKALDPSNFQSLKELADARNICRGLSADNPFAICGHENRISYICGDGHKYDPVVKDGEEVADEELAKIKAELEAWLKLNKWPARQQEIVRRLDRDGEVFLRLFVDAENVVRVRFVAPGDVAPPDSETGNPDAAFGIKTDPDDAETVLGYWIDGEYVEAAEIQHRKANVDSNVLRGRPTFWSIRTNLRKACKILHNIAITSDIQTAIAIVRRHTGGTSAGLLNMQATSSDYRYTDASSGATRFAKRYPAGSIIDSTGNTEYDFPAAGIDVEKHVSGVQAQLRAASSRLVMPEFMFTSDASNANYSSTMIAESPSVRMFGRLQASMREDDLELIWAAMRLAADAGRINREALEKIEIQVGMPPLEVRDKKAETETNAILNEKGVLSLQSWAGKAGLDYDQERKNFEEAGAPPVDGEADPALDLPDPTTPANTPPAPGLPIPPGSPAPAAGEPIVSDEILNGAQLASATQIVIAAAAGTIPRDAALGLLQVLFKLTPEQAGSVLGTAGTGSTTTPNVNPKDEAQLAADKAAAASAPKPPATAFENLSAAAALASREALLKAGYPIPE